MSAQSVQTERLAAFQAALAREEIDLSELRALMSAGLPEGHADTQGMRSVCWKLVRRIARCPHCHIKHECSSNVSPFHHIM